MLKRVLLLPLFLTLVNTGCKKESPTSGVPNVSVGFTDNIDDLPNLLNALGWYYIANNTGYDGLIHYCQTPGTYLAFDRGCPYDCQTNTKAVIVVQTGNITAKCPVCGTTYSLYSG
jgi:hypothetical protein